jgi:hypothetical protein
MTIVQDMLDRSVNQVGYQRVVTTTYVGELKV